MLWVKALHIIFITCWFAGIFYLPRLFVYHAMAEDQASRELLKIMESKLYKFMSMLAVLGTLLGLWLVTFNTSYYLQAPWFFAKVALVIILVIYHLVCGRYVRQFQQDDNIRNHVFYRWFNELPVLILFAVVILVVVRPF